jgi:hypothetical protein
LTIGANDLSNGHGEVRDIQKLRLLSIIATVTMTIVPIIGMLE